MPSRCNTRRLMEIAEKGPLDPKRGQNASRLRRLVAKGYLRKGADGLFYRTEKPYPVASEVGFDFEAHRRRWVV